MSLQKAYLNPIEKELAILMNRISTKDIFKSRENRDWRAFDRMSENKKTFTRVQEIKNFIKNKKNS